MQVPAYTVIMEIRQPDQVCTVTFTAQQPPSVISIPGTTFSTVISQQSYVTTLVTQEGGVTVTRTGMENVAFTTMGFTMTLPMCGVSSEYCNLITITEIVTYILESVPAEILFAFEGVSTTIAGTTLTLEVGDYPPVTATLTRTEAGKTTRFTETQRGTTVTTTQIIQPTTITAVVTRQGTTSTEIVTVVLTLQQTTTPLTETTPTTTVATSPITSPITPTTTVAPQQGLGIDILIPIVALVIIVAVVVFALRLRH